MFQHTLNNPTAIRMRCQTMYLSGESVDDELDMFRRDSLDSFLNNMIPVLVLDTFEHMIFQLFYKESLLVGKDMLQRLFSQNMTK